MPRPPGKKPFARFLVALILSVVVASQQLQQHDQREEQDSISSLKKHIEDFVKPQNNVRAIATYAHSESHAVRAQSSGFKPVQSATGGSTLQAARDLENWEVEDIVLLATIDGRIIAVHRTTGKMLWSLGLEDKPMVETIYHRNNSESRDWTPEHEHMWIIEPSRDGPLYIFNQNPDPSLQKTFLTIKKLVESSPFQTEDPPVVYIGEKKSELYRVDALTGVILRMFTPGGSSNPLNDKCPKSDGIKTPGGDECGSRGILTIGRTEYTVRVSGGEDGSEIATLKYSEWGPNNRDTDLHTQYVSSMDKKYVFSMHDGRALGFDYNGGQGEKKQLYEEQFSSPVARVFDIARPANPSPEKGRPLVLLPQPHAPIVSAIDRTGEVLVNCTESGGWYAMSEATYPAVTNETDWAQCYSRWGRRTPPIHDSGIDLQKEMLVGKHNVHAQPKPRIGLPAPVPAPSTSVPFNPIFPPEIIEPPRELPLVPAPAKSNNLFNSFTFMAIILLATLAFWRNGLELYNSKLKVATDKPEKVLTIDEPQPNADSAIKDFALEAPPMVEPVLSEKSTEGTTETKLEVSETEIKKRPIRFLVPEPSDLEKQISNEEPYMVEDPVPNGDIDADNDGDTIHDETGMNEQENADRPKKKAHRGRRGGKKNRRKNTNSSQDDPVDIQQVIDNIQPIDSKDPYPSRMVIEDLEIYTDKVLGFGSHGTVVYEGRFSGRRVAVKALLNQYYEIYHQECELLKDADVHRNVVRYHCRKQHAQFLYIALELCQGSLQQVVDIHRGLINSDNQELIEIADVCKSDVPKILLQIAAGVRSLHDCKIVHRDLKPQNILVSQETKAGKTDAVLLISDFGLCKKLEGDQSSFRATTAHAAGTLGWRAPELLEDAKNPAPHTSESNHTGGSEHLIVAVDSVSNRRATRAIDIFSLGCVFYYVLTSGGHPFDANGQDKYGKESNIVKDLSDLSELIWRGDSGFEAENLIRNMIAHEPRDRPNINEVMMHPFFWSAKKRLDFLVDVSDVFEFEIRDPPSPNLQILEASGLSVFGHHKERDWLKALDRSFVDTLGKQRKYTGTRMLDLLRALRNKKSHWLDMPSNVQAMVGSIPAGYLQYWTTKFPPLLLECHAVVRECGLETHDKLKEYFENVP